MSPTPLPDGRHADLVHEIDAKSLWILMSAISGILHIAAPGAVDGVMPRRNRIVLGVGMGVAVMCMCVVLWTRPDISDDLDSSRFVLEDAASWLPSLVDRAGAALWSCLGKSG